MTKLGEPVPEILTQMQEHVERLLTAQNIKCIKADSLTTGKDFLHKIWELVVTVPMGIAIIHEDISCETLANIFYELGLMQALGKETLVIKTDGAPFPSDFVRTEYVPYDLHFEKRFQMFLESIDKRADYFCVIAEQVENNPLLAIDYYRRAFLLTGEKELQCRSIEILNSAGLNARAKNSVEMLLAGFAKESSPHMTFRARVANVK